MNLSERKGWSTPVHPRAQRVDHPKPQDVAGVFSGWSTGPPQFHFCRVKERKERSEPHTQTRHYLKNSRFGVDRWTTPMFALPPCGGLGRSTQFSRGWTRVDHPREVTL